MNGLGQICAAVIVALQEAGITAVNAYQGVAKRYDGPVAAVDVESAAESASGMGNYLGQIVDPKTGEVKELYGWQMDAKILLEVRAPSAAACEQAMETAAGVLLGGLPSGLRPQEISWAGISWDKRSGMFLRKGILRCKAFFTAESGEEAGTLLDFILKGTMRQ